MVIYPLETKQSVVFTKEGVNSKPKESNTITCFSVGAAAQRGLWTPQSRGFFDHTQPTPHSR